MGTKNVGSGASKSRLPRTHQASEAHRKNKRIRKTTERTLLQEMVAKLDQDKGAMGQLIDTMLQNAKAGDKDAAAFIGKYLLGNGKVSLDDLYNPPVVRKAK